MGMTLTIMRTFPQVRYRSNKETLLYQRILCTDETQDGDLATAGNTSSK